MKPDTFSKNLKQVARFICAMVAFAGILIPGNADLFAQTPQATTQTSSTTQESPKIPPEQLDSLVAPIALYPDNLLSQTLVSSTYPLEIVQLHQWLDR
jgi:hypothetical protein